MGEGLVDKLQREDHLDLQVTWLPFELHPDIPPQGVEIAAYLGIPPARLEQMNTHLRVRAAELGLPLGENRKIVNTHKALLLTEWTRQQASEQLPALHRALFRAYFADGSNLADEAVLQLVCAQVGLPADAALSHLHDPPFEKRLTESMELARAYGITGAPTFIINNRYKIVGAQPYDVLLKTLRQFAVEHSSTEPPLGS